MSDYTEKMKSISYRNVNNNTVTEGDYAVDLETGNLLSIRGNVNVRETNPDNGDVVIGRYIGGFNGHPEGGDMSYGFSNMTLTDLLLVMAAIQEILPHAVQPSSSSED
jgi:hypothetical protein